jgi:hypothetical protein
MRYLALILKYTFSNSMVDIFLRAMEPIGSSNNKFDKKLTQYSHALPTTSKSSFFFMTRPMGKMKKTVAGSGLFQRCLFVPREIDDVTANNMKKLSDNKHLFLNYRFFDSDYFKNLEQFLTLNDNYIKTYEPSKDFTIFIFEIPKEFHDDIILFKEGKYSQFSNEAKERILLFNQTKITSKLFKVLYNDISLRKDMEKKFNCKIPNDIDLIDIPSINDETFIINK